MINLKELGLGRGDFVSESGQPPLPVIKLILKV